EVGTANDDIPLRLLVTDEGRGKYFKRLIEVPCYVTNRVERELIKKRAQMLLEARFKSDGCADAEIDLGQFQSNDGGIAEVAWGGSSIQTSAWAAVIDSNSFDQSKMKVYFEKVIASD